MKRTLEFIRLARSRLSEIRQRATISTGESGGRRARRSPIRNLAPLALDGDAGGIADLDPDAATIAIITAVTVAPFALLGQCFAPNVAKDLRHQSEMLSQAGEATQRARLRRAAEPSISIAA
jgi:hypothetical protein